MPPGCQHRFGECGRFGWPLQGAGGPGGELEFVFGMCKYVVFKIIEFIKVAALSS